MGDHSELASTRARKVAVPPQLPHIPPVNPAEHEPHGLGPSMSLPLNPGSLARILNEAAAL
ncbi:hypothetical protein ACFVVM_32525 [Nocardia sp. NPDC058176]|uniref:hypothetical protein n=1 Tax=Nocardia sp. NPDC058176 TaxID=3346368 RepID=UPI0036DC26B2